MVRGIALVCLLSSTAPLAQADDALSFDRPGLPFATAPLPRGGIAWEQGLPDVEFARTDDGIQREYVAASVLRLGLGARGELQLATDAQVWQHDTGPRAARGHGGGDTTLGLKVALPSSREDFSWALLGQLSLPTAAAGFGDDAAVRTLATTLRWNLPEERALTLYADASDAASGRSWTLAANYTFFARGDVSSYVEAAAGHGEHGTQGLGGGIAWMLGEHVQLDLSVLRGIGSDAPDWQGGLGVSVGFL